MSGKPSKQKLKHHSVTTPWKPQIPYLTDGFAAARDQVLDDPRRFYEGQTVAGFTAEQRDALSQMAARARAGSAVTRNAGSHLASVLEGKYLQAGNPHLQGAIEAASRPLVDGYRQAVGGIGSGFARAGRYGSHAQAFAEGQAQSLLARQLSDQAAGLAHADYSAERQRMLDAARLAPEVAQADYADADRLFQVGAARQAQSQAEIDADRERHDFDENEAWDRLLLYMQLVGGHYGGTTSGYQTAPGPSKLDNALKYAQVLESFTRSNKNVADSASNFRFFGG